MLAIILGLLNFIRTALSILAGGWMLILVWHEHGVLGVLAFLFLYAFLSRLGTAPLLAVIATLLCVHFKTVGWWFPIVSYAIALVSPILFLVLAKDATKEQLQKHIEQNEVVSPKREDEHDETIWPPPPIRADE